MIKVLDLPLSEDLSGFAEFLWQHEIPHRILEEGEYQQLWVSRAVDPEKIVTLFRMWQQGADLSSVQVSFHPTRPGTIAVGWQQVWLTLALIFLSLGFSFLIGMGENFAYLRLFTFTDVVEHRQQIFSTNLLETLRNFELWRLITPIFLHFSFMHVLFNLLWVWVVGSKVEYFHGRLVLLGLVLFSALSSNLAQYLISGPLFGGMSGVVFALLGYAWLWDKRHPRNPIGLPPALMGFMVFWLVLGYTGILESLGFGSIANTAHLVGLVCGLLYTFIAERLPNRQRG